MCQTDPTNFFGQVYLMRESNLSTHTHTQENEKYNIRKYLVKRKQTCEFEITFRAASVTGLLKELRLTVPLGHVTVLHLLVAVNKESIVDVPHQIIEKFTIICKFFRDAVFGSEIIAADQ